MSENFCLTINEAAEMTGLTVTEILDLSAAVEGVAIQVGDAWRVAPEALGAAMAGTYAKAA